MMEFSSAGSHMIMQGFEPNGDIYSFQSAFQSATNPNPNPTPDHWYQVNGFAMRPNQGLSLSLSNPMSISDHQEQLFMDDGSERILFQSSQLQQPFILRRSKYLIPAQELLNEFCNLGVITGMNTSAGSKKKEHKKASSQWDEGGPSSLYSMDIVEIQKRKARLLSMLEEVYRRYRTYCEQMRAVVSSFEAVAGQGSATVYSTQASKAMSRHFRCLKDGIMPQIQASKMAMGERDSVAPGATRGETPRLKKLEQCLRQQKAFHQAGIIESQPWRPQRGLPEHSVSVLRAWLFEHFFHPYPSDVDKHILARQTGLSRSQVSNWFINARVRLWKPMVEEMYMEELNEEEKSTPNPNPNASSSGQLDAEEQKPVLGLLINDSDSLSSIINNHRHHHLNGENITNNHDHHPNPNFDVVDLDFSSYSGSGVSLTLGLQQQQSLLFSREHIDDNQPGQFSILDEEGQNLPYRNLMGAQLLHDLTG